ncbi:MAG: peptide deformylase [Pseudomonadota bacterium]
MLPTYVSADDPIHRTKAKILSFPLTAEDLEAVRLLEMRFDVEMTCVGLAATQIGIGKAIIIVSVPSKDGTMRKDIVEKMPKTILINPSFKKIGSEMTGDWEGCYTIPETMSYVKRCRKIGYTAYKISGEKVTGTANGFLARVIQHEIDRTNGIVYADKAAKTLSKSDYVSMVNRY